MKKFLYKLIFLMLFNYSHGINFSKKSITKISDHEYTMWMVSDLKNDKIFFDDYYSRCDQHRFFPEACDKYKNKFLLNKVKNLYQFDLKSNQMCEIKTLYYHNNTLLIKSQHFCDYENIITDTFGDTAILFLKKNLNTL